MGLGAGAKISEIDIAGFVATDRNDFETGHDSAGWIRAVCGGRDQANIAVRLAATGVVSVDNQQAGVFALGASVGLKRDSGKPSNLGEPIFELLKKRLVAAGLSQRCEWMKAAEFGPADREHFGAGIELHRAGAEGNHGGREGKIARFEPLEIPEHLGFGMVAIEDRVD